MSTKNNLWYGYLEAGNRSSAIVLDQRLETGDPSTLYLFNLQRGAFVEYKRELVEPKMRELGKLEEEILDELKSEFNKARSQFQPRGNRVQQMLRKSGSPSAGGGKSNRNDDLIDYDGGGSSGGDDDIDHSDWESDDDN
jgi:hypothetical protein